MKTWSGTPYHMLSHMRAHKVDVEVLSPLSTRAKYWLAPIGLLARARKKSVTLDHFPLTLRAYAGQIEAFVRDRGIDVIFSPSTIPITLLDCGKPIVTWTDAVFHSMHDYYGKTFANMPPSAVARGKWQEETALRNCRMALCASRWALEGARSIADSSKLRVLPFGANLPVHHTSDDVARTAAGKRLARKKQCELLFVGVDWERKGGAIAVETARLLNEAGIQTRLRVVGSQAPGDLPSFVEVLGFIDKTSESGKKKLIELFRGADIFILPTRAEAAGVAFAEASAYGLPCVTYATGGATEYVHSGVNGVCIEPGGSAERFADEICGILESPGAYEAYASRAFQEYANRLNWEKSVRQLIQYCSECARN